MLALVALATGWFAIVGDFDVVWRDVYVHEKRLHYRWLRRFSWSSRILLWSTAAVALLRIICIIIVPAIALLRRLALLLLLLTRQELLMLQLQLFCQLRLRRSHLLLKFVNLFLERLVLFLKILLFSAELFDLLLLLLMLFHTYLYRLLLLVYNFFDSNVCDYQCFVFFQHLFMYSVNFIIFVLNCFQLFLEFLDLYFIKIFLLNMLPYSLFILPELLLIFLRCINSWFRNITNF